jgi:hypothetical protein
MSERIDIHPALKHRQAEIDAAAAANDVVTIRRIIEECGLTWFEDEWVERTPTE